MDKGRTSSEAFAFFSFFFAGEVVLVGKGLAAMAYSAIEGLDPFLLPLLPAQQAFLAPPGIFALLGPATFLDRYLQVVLPSILRRFSQRQT